MTVATVEEVHHSMEILERVDTVAKIIGVAPSTLKKYYLLFEEHGYFFKRSNEGHVLFDTHDVELLKRLIVLKNEPGMTVKKAVQQIVKEEGITVPEKTDTTTSTMDVTVMNQVAIVMTELEELKALMKEQNELLKKQEKYIDEKLKERDLKLVSALRQSQEEKRAMKEMVATIMEEQQKNKKNFWTRLFGK